MNTTARFAPVGVDFSNFKPQHFAWRLEGKVATITLNRPERKNPLTLESYAELRDTFRNLRYCDFIKTVVLTGAGGNFCSGGDGAGAILAMASDLRYGTPNSKTAFLFVRVGLAGADMGACNILPRLIGAGRAAELLYTGRSMDGAEAERWGFFNRLCDPEHLLGQAHELALSIASGPTFAHAMTKKCIHQEWSMGIDDAIEAEAQAQAICMQTKDYERAYNAFVAKQRPVFEGN